jgi:hypothetical protein
MMSAFRRFPDSMNMLSYEADLHFSSLLSPVSLYAFLCARFSTGLIPFSENERSSFLDLHKK